jgi:hypothetical protein
MDYILSVVTLAAINMIAVLGAFDLTGFYGIFSFGPCGLSSRRGVCVRVLSITLRPVLYRARFAGRSRPRSGRVI